MIDVSTIKNLTGASDKVATLWQPIFNRKNLKEEGDELCQVINVTKLFMENI